MNDPFLDYSTEGSATIVAAASTIFDVFWFQPFYKPTYQIAVSSSSNRAYPSVVEDIILGTQHNKQNSKRPRAVCVAEKPLENASPRRRCSGGAYCIGFMATTKRELWTERQNRLGQNNSSAKLCPAICALPIFLR